ncbi:type II secretion system secretin GspD [Sphingomonas sp.]|uniref:type II secretion system secretin GspD n=1 Tax=Sphingomonas sp. TaxID=28214 RepID=UPI0035C83E61
MRISVVRSMSLLAVTLAAATPALAQITLNVRDADIRAFIADAAKVTGRTFIIDNRVQGKVTVVTDRPLSRSEYLEAFLSTLRANGLVAVPAANGAFRVQPIDNAATQPGRVGVSGAARNQLVTEIVRLRSIDAAQALDTVRPLVSAQGSVTANRGGNSLVVVDFADNVRRVREVIRRIDADTSSTRIVALRNARASEVATALQGLVAGQGGAGAGAVGGVSAVAIESSNAVALRGDPQTVARLAALARDLDQSARNATEIKVVFLENADATQLVPVLQQLVGQSPDAIQEQTLSRAGLSSSSTGSTGVGATPQPAARSSAPQSNQQQQQSGGQPQQAAITGEGRRTAAVVTRFAGANAIVIAAPADVQRQLTDVIQKLDQRRQQVLVEAIVAEVSDSTVNQLGAQFILGNLDGGAFAASTFSNSAPNILQIAGAIGARELGGTTTSTTSGGITTTTTTNNTATDQLTQSAISSIIGSTGGFGGFGGQIGSTVFGAIINAVKSDTQSNLLQVPQIMTLDNQEAHTLVGQEVPITTGEALSNNFDNAFRTTQRQNVGIGLDVRPQVNSSGTIKLNLHLEVSSIAGAVSSNNSDLILNKREVETVLTVDDGAIGVIGGLLSDEERRTIERIPLLSDIPLLGNLFKSKAKTRSKTNLMIFIRPTVIRTAEDNRRVSEQRYGYLRLQQGLQDPLSEPSIDTLVRDYMGTTPPLPPAGQPGSIEDQRIGVPVYRNSVVTIPGRRK